MILNRKRLDAAETGLLGIKTKYILPRDEGFYLHGVLRRRSTSPGRMSTTQRACSGYGSTRQIPAFQKQHRVNANQAAVFTNPILGRVALPTRPDEHS